MLRKFFQRRVKTKNSRRFKRIRAAYLVKYQVNGKGEPRITNARDISAGGLRFWTEEKILPSSVLKISVYFPPLERAVEGTAQVLRMRRSKEGYVYYVAVSFLDLNQKDGEDISQFAEEISKEKDARLLIDHADIVVRKKP